MQTRRPRILEAGLAGVVLLGYLLAMGGTSAGQGWALLGHVTSEHRTPLAPPGLQPALPTLRTEGFTTLRSLAPEAGHSHGEHSHKRQAHTHESPRSAHPDAYRTVRAVWVEEAAPEASGDDAGHVHGSALADGFHAHGDEIHRHDAPPADPAPVALSLDKHRLPLAPTLAPPPVRAQTWAARGDGFASVETWVETPPPLARG